jgi:hypothetical protein
MFHQIPPDSTPKHCFLGQSPFNFVFPIFQILASQLGHHTSTLAFGQPDEIKRTQSNTLEFSLEFPRFQKCFLKKQFP